MTDIDKQMMSRALELAREGDPSPNPHVGCVIAKGETVVAEGFHQSVGNDHAEMAALRVAKANPEELGASEATRGATLYVTLEPCNHEGRTPPCVDAILKAGIKRVVIGCEDPNPSVEGGGIDRLREAGLDVTVGVARSECEQLIRPWRKFITQSSAYLIVKLALSLDGRIATRSGSSKWITGSEARTQVHALRARYDAVMVGINTVLSDDPLLTVRDVKGRNPARVVVDSKLRIPVSSQLIATAQETPTCVVTTTDAPDSAVEAIEQRGVTIIRVPASPEGRCDMRAALKELAAREVVSVLCEGGAELTGSLLANHIADEMHAFIAPIMLGPRGLPGVLDWAGPESPSDAPRIEPPRWELVGNDAYVSGPLVYPPPVLRT